MSTIGVTNGRLFVTDAPWTRWVIVAVHVAFIVPAVFLAGQWSGPSTVFVPWPPQSSGLALTIPLGLVLLALQLRLSLAFGSGHLPRLAPWLFLAIVALVYLPAIVGLTYSSLIWLDWGWIQMSSYPMAAAPMVLRGRLALIGIAVVLFGAVVRLAQADAGTVAGPSIVAALWFVIYASGSIGLPAAGMYGSARLASTVEALRDARAELAAVAVINERRRFALDLHDLLGQTLSAISLKGDLAIRLLASDPHAAREEIKGLTELARQAVRGVREIGRDERIVSLRDEADGAAALLAAAGVTARVALDLGNLTPQQDALLAWAVREGVANALRHSEARTCSITGRKREGKIVLEIVNDGATGQAGEGSGLAGLAERARPLAATVFAGPTPGDGFRLLVEVPEVAA